MRRRTAVQVGASALLGLGIHHFSALKQLAANEGNPVAASPKAVI
jgi:hypothetical protein